MKKDDVSIGATYTAKVSGGVVPVYIKEERWIGDDHRGWIGINTLTGRSVTIKSAQRLQRAVALTPAGDDAPTESAAQHENGTSVAAAGSPVPPKAAAKVAKKNAKAIKAKTGKSTAKPVAPAPKPDKDARPPKPKKDPSKLSGLSAAAKILAESGKPMNCKEIVAEAFKKNLWRSEGATPEATINAAIIREIAKKGKDSRFVKKDRGLFAVKGD
jgi:hypothetical protein